MCSGASAKPAGDGGRGRWEAHRRLVPVIRSDGVWDFISTHVVEKLLKNVTKPRHSLSWLANALMKSVRETNIEADDATLVCVALPPLAVLMERSSMPAKAIRRSTTSNIGKFALKLGGFGKGRTNTAPLSSPDSNTDVSRGSTTPGSSSRGSSTPRRGSAASRVLHSLPA